MHSYRTKLIPRVRCKPASRFVALAFFIFVLSIIISGCKVDSDQPTPGKTQTNLQTRATVIKVKDGDSIILRYPNSIEKEARLFGIDAPEYNQAYGKQAKRTLEKLVLKKSVLVVNKDTDRYQREIVILYREADRLDVNLELVKVGSAWVYTQYQNDKIWGSAENKAKQQGLGLWALNNPVPPWVWRRK